MNIASYEAYCFDLDGTVFIGDQLLPGVQETLMELRARGKKILFLTNSSVHTRQDCQKRLAGMGLLCQEEEILTALYVSGMYFARQLPEAILYLVGEEVMSWQMKLCGVPTTEIPEAATHVLIGMDRGFNYEKLRLGMNAARSGASLVAVNPDPVCPVPGGYIPDTWSIVKALETAAGKQSAMIIGKPSLDYAEEALRKLNIDPELCLMVGDRLETDILMGSRSGMHTALVLTGVSRREDILAQGIEPHYVLDSLADILLAEPLL
ncbi:haloacid dehalogenase [Paenibacillus sp. PK3_47]|uniref:HAD-IIA family hydrolase n=1 Tax=Paenibacillus sp. PK3_47 TaxID=2072642 RepID=UPI00201DC093|nr:HAD-IIA family hydrolase [Paenibacillus sp. PK3_47]UQZ36816.1 haloacid dehalogenase [Paenibacillus sp. PK3_47]